MTPEQITLSSGEHELQGYSCTPGGPMHLGVRATWVDLGRFFMSTGALHATGRAWSCSSCSLSWTCRPPVSKGTCINHLEKRRLDREHAVVEALGHTFQFFQRSRPHARRKVAHEPFSCARQCQKVTSPAVKYFFMSLSELVPVSVGLPSSYLEAFVYRGPWPALLGECRSKANCTDAL